MSYFAESLSFCPPHLISAATLPRKMKYNIYMAWKKNCF